MGVDRGQDTVILPRLAHQRLTRRCRLPYAPRVSTVAGCTTVAIARRLSSVESTDAIDVTDEGQVVRQGKHDGLAACGGPYVRLYEMQFNAEAQGRAGES